MSRLSDLASWASRHRRLLGALQLLVLIVFFVSLGWALRSSVSAAGYDSRISHSPRIRIQPSTKTR